MSKTECFSHHRPAPPGAVRRLADRILSVLQDCHYAQRRVLELRMSPDAYLIDARAAPDTYAEFLLRTDGLLLREPSARARARQASRGARSGPA